MKTETVIRLAAMAAHEANKAYCDACGDSSQKPWDAAPDWQKESAMCGVRQIAEHPETTPEQSHEGWLKTKEADGWKYGPTKDADKKEHPCFVPYGQLPPQQRVKDLLFGTIVRAVLAHHGILPVECV